MGLTLVQSLFAALFAAGMALLITNALDAVFQIHNNWITTPMLLAFYLILYFKTRTVFKQIFHEKRKTNSIERGLTEFIDT